MSIFLVPCNHTSRPFVVKDTTSRVTSYYGKESLCLSYTRSVSGVYVSIIETYMIGHLVLTPYFLGVITDTDDPFLVWSRGLLRTPNP